MEDTHARDACAVRRASSILVVRTKSVGHFGVLGGSNPLLASRETGWLSG